MEGRAGLWGGIERTGVLEGGGTRILGNDVNGG